jgi:hypothetical protein
MTDNRYSPPASAVADPAAGGPPPPMPPAVKLAVRFMWATLVLSAVSSALTWFESPTLADSTMEVIAFIFVLLFSFGITIVLILYIQRGANWARVVNLLLFVFGAASYIFVAAKDATQSPQSPALRVLEIVSWGISIASLVMLYFPAANTWFREMRAYRLLR